MNKNFRGSGLSDNVVHSLEKNEILCFKEKIPK